MVRSTGSPTLKMASSTCPLCYNLDFARIRKLTENTCSIGQVARHWMRTSELHTSADGILGTREPCDICALLRDATETFLYKSGLVANTRLLEYMVAVQNDVDSDVENKPSDDMSDGDSSSVSSWEDAADGEDDLADGAANLSVTVTNTSVGKRGPERLKLVMRCNLGSDNANDEHDFQEEFELEVFTVPGGKCLSDPFSSLQYS
jgi:hypothetical protein